MTVMLAWKQDGIRRRPGVDAQLDDPGGVDEGRVGQEPISDDSRFGHDRSVSRARRWLTFL